MDGAPQKIRFFFPSRFFPMAGEWTVGREIDGRIAVDDAGEALTTTTNPLRRRRCAWGEGKFHPPLLLLPHFPLLLLPPTSLRRHSHQRKK